LYPNRMHSTSNDALATEGRQSTHYHPRDFPLYRRYAIARADGMKVILIQPPVQDFYDTDVRLQPIGLCYLKPPSINICRVSKSSSKTTTEVADEARYRFRRSS